MDDVYVRFVHLPRGVDEIVAPFEDGYNVYIDDMLDEISRLDAYSHAMRHINSNDWQFYCVQDIETRTHVS